MCQMSLKLPIMFDQYPPRILDKIVAKEWQKSPYVKVIAKIERYQPREQKTGHP